MFIKVNLLEPGPLVSVGRLWLELDRSRDNFLQRMFERQRYSIDAIELKVKIEDSIELKPEAHLIGFEDESGDITPELLNVSVGSLGFDVGLACDPSAVQDWLSRSERLSFQYWIEAFSEGDVHRAYEGQLHLEVSRPPGEVAWSYSVVDVVQHDMRRSRVKVADIHVSNGGRFAASQPASAIVVLTAPELFCGKSVPDGTFSLGEPTGDGEVQNSVVDSSEIEISGVYPRTSVTLPVWVDFNKLPNPPSPQSIPLKVNAYTMGSYRISPHPESADPDVATIVITRDGREVAPLVRWFGQYLDATEHDPASWWPHHPTEADAQKYAVEADRAILLPASEENGEGEYELFVFRLGNQGGPGSGTVIFNRVEVALDIPRGSLIEFKPNRSTDLLKLLHPDSQLSIEDFLELNRDFEPERPHELFSLMLDPKVIHRAPRTPAALTVVVKIAGRCESAQGPSELFFCQARLHLQLSQSLGDQWMALDFGTSGIVSVLGKGERTPKPLVLGPARESILPTMLFAKRGRELTERAFVDFELQRHKQQESWDSRIPYLKNIIGSKNVPLLTSDFPHTLNGEQRNSRPDTQLTLESSFMALFEHFLNEAIEHKFPDGVPPLRQIILTTPNGFYGRHKRALERAVLFALKEEAGNVEILFVSESDAVAYYYYHNWRVINHGQRNEEELIWLRQPTSHAAREYILIYDLGAGTLDMTYLCVTRRSREESSTDEMEILARLGRQSAGNNLDTLIAKSFIELQATNDVRTVCPLMPVSRQDALENFAFRLTFKEFAERLKLWFSASEQGLKVEYPTLASGEALIFEAKPELMFEAKDLRENVEIKAFIEDITEGALNELLGLVPAELSDGTGLIDGNGRLPVDTVITTGRCVQYPGITEALMAAVQKRGADMARPVKVELDADLKEVVAQGAYMFAQSNSREELIRLTQVRPDAWYGLIFKDIDDQHVFVDLICPDQRFPTDTPNPKVSGRAEINLSRSTELIVVKSFTAQPIEVRYGLEHMKYSAKVMARFSRELLGVDSSGYASVKVSMDFMQDGTVRGRFGGVVLDEKDSLFAEQGLDSTDETHWEGMWPFVVDIGEAQ